MRIAVTRRQKLTLALIASCAVAVAIAHIAAKPKPFEFRDLAFAPGFRELIEKADVSTAGPAIDPLIGLGTGARPPTGTSRRIERGGICRALFRDPDTPVAGDGDALPVAEFFDYRCPYCRVLTDHLTRLAREGRVRLAYKEWPILGDGSVLAARAALAADQQGKYAAAHERLMRARLIPTDGYIKAVAEELGLDHGRLRADMRSGGITAQLDRTAALARALRLRGTPALVVGRTVVKGAISPDRLDALIDLEAAGAPPLGC